VTINDGAVSLWSTRLWMAYVVLQLAHLREDRALLVKRQRALEKLSARSKLQPQERAELARRWDAWYNEFAVNLSYLPMTIIGQLSLPFLILCAHTAYENFNPGHLRKVFSETTLVHSLGCACALAG